MKYSTKIIQKSAKTTPFAGIFFIEDYFDRYKIGELCDEVLGIRAKQAKYSYADIIKSLWMIAFTGGQALEDINNQTGSVLKLRPGARAQHRHIPFEDGLRQLQQENHRRCFAPQHPVLHSCRQVQQPHVPTPEGRTVARSRAEL